MRRRLIPVFLIWILQTVSAFSQQSEKFDKSEMAEIKALVIDPDGNPVADAMVHISGLKSKLQHGWPNSREIVKRKTDEAGLVTLSFPKQFVQNDDVLSVDITVSHTEFAPQTEHSLITVPLAEITLKRGFKIAVSAIDAETLEPIKENLYAWTGDGAQRWQLFENGMLVSPTLTPKQTFYRLIKIVDGQPVAFSEILMANPDGKTRMVVKDVLLYPSVKIRGRISDNVPRPIRHGTVSLVIYKRWQTDEANDHQWAWYDKTLINEDGSFDFPHIPANETIQLFPLCEGWLPRTPSVEIVRAIFPKTQILHETFSYPTPVLVDDQPLSVILDMDSGRTIVAKVLNEQDEPVPGITVAVWPNQYIFDGGTQHLGAGHKTVEELLENEVNRPRTVNQLFDCETDISGTATIIGVPPKYSSGIITISSDFEMVDGGPLGVSFKMLDQPTTEVTLRVKRIKK